MKSPPPTPSNNVEASLHTLTTLFKGVRGECLTCTCLFDSIYFGQDCRKLFTIYRGLHPKSDVDRLYIHRKKGGRGLISIEYCVELAIKGLEVYVHGSEERLIQATRGDKIDSLEAVSVLKR